MTNPVDYEMLSLCQRLSPTGVEQAAFAKIYNDMRAEGETEKSIVCALVFSLLDGLEYGNWPEGTLP